MVGRRIDLTAFGVTKEVVQSIKTASSIVVCSMLPNITSVADWVVNWSITGLLLRRVIAVVAIVLLNMPILRGWAGVHVLRVIIISRSRSWFLVSMCFERGLE